MRILLSGCSGLMGEVVSKQLGEEIVCGYGRGQVVRTYPVFTNIEEIDYEVDAIIDFSHPNALSGVLHYAVKKGIPVVVATTGLEEQHHKEIDTASNHIPILQSGNFSMGINTMANIVERLASILRKSDIEILEAHHRHKADAPSGTAQMLAGAVMQGRGSDYQLKHGREKGHHLRDSHEIGIHSIRGGSIAGEHTVRFMADDETIEITHRAFSKNVFAFGAKRAAEFLLTKSSGRYNMSDVFVPQETLEKVKKL